MINIAGSAGTGKTKKLLELAKDTGATVVCENVDRLHMKALSYGLVGLQYMAYSEYADECIKAAEGNTAKSGRTFLIDDIGKFISYFSPETVGFTSLTEVD